MTNTSSLWGNPFRGVMSKLLSRYWCERSWGRKRRVQGDLRLWDSPML